MDWKPLAEELVDGARSSLVVIGRGGMGTNAALDDVERLAAAKGLAVRRLRGRRLDRGEAFATVEDLLDADLVEALLEDAGRVELRRARRELIVGLDPGLLLVEDAQWADPESLGLLAAVAGRLTGSGLRMVITLRPRSDDRELAALVEVLSSIHRPVTVSHASEDDARKVLENSVLGTAFEDHLAALAVATGGAPFLIESLIEDAADLESLSDWLGGGGCPPVCLEAVRSRIAVLSEVGQQVLLAMSFGASATTELIDVLQLDDDEALGQAIVELEDEGLLTADGGDVIPLVAEAATQLQPPIERRRHHRLYADVLEQRGGSSVARAEHLLNAEAPPIELAPVCLAAADELMIDAPSLALDWIDRGAEAGLAPTALAGRRVEAHLRDGRVMDALRVAEPLFREEAPDRLDALQLAAVAFVHARRPRQAASILRQIAPRLDGEAGVQVQLAASLCQLAGGGDIDEAVELDRPHSNPTIEVARLLQQAFLLLISGDAADGEDPATIVTGAVDLELAALGEQRLPYVADAVGVALAMYDANLPLAERLARSARAAPAATDALRRSRALRASLVEMWTGATAEGNDGLDEWAELGPGDRLTAVAIAAGRARRQNDAVRLRALLDVVHEVLLIPPDLVNLPAYSEVMLAAARLGATERVSEAQAARDQMLGTLGDPESVRLYCSWIDIQCAAASDHQVGLTATGARLASQADPVGRPARLLVAARAWSRLLHREGDSESISAAGRELEALGYRWEATRLVGSAAMRLDDETEARGLLATARELRAGLAQVGGESAPLSARLSGRELEVAELLLGGNTYKEIGARLYISPKTVEHHVARIRQRLDVTSRAELLEVLRDGLQPGAD